MAYKTQHKGDEFYTKREDVIMMCEQYLSELRRPGCRVLCPCDTDESEFVKYLCENGVDVTWNNDLCYQNFDFSDFDWVITNPPFSLMGDFLRRIAEAECGGLIIMPLASLGHEGGQRLLQKGWHAYDEGVPVSFIRPDGSEQQSSRIVVLTHQDEWEHRGTKRRQVPAQSLPPIQTREGVPRYQRVCDVPDEWEGLIAVPISWACVKYEYRRHEIVGHQVLTKPSGELTFNSWIIKCR